MNLLEHPHSLKAEQQWKSLADLISEDPSLFLIGNYEFIGPFADCKFILALPGLLAVMSETAAGVELLEIQESSNLLQSARIESRKSSRNADETVVFAAHYTSYSHLHDIQNLKEEVMRELND
jgi:hypothetical protein